MPSHVAPSRSRLKSCAFCDRTFVKAEHLKRHQRSHTGERPFKCRKCGRSYGRSDVLSRHLTTHCSERENDRPDRPSPDPNLTPGEYLPAGDPGVGTGGTFSGNDDDCITVSGAGCTDSHLLPAVAVAKLSSIPLTRASVARHHELIDSLGREQPHAPLESEPMRAQGPANVAADGENDPVSWSPSNDATNSVPQQSSMQGGQTASLPSGGNGAGDQRPAAPITESRSRVLHSQSHTHVSFFESTAANAASTTAMGLSTQRDVQGGASCQDEQHSDAYVNQRTSQTHPNLDSENEHCLSHPAAFEGSAWQAFQAKDLYFGLDMVDYLDFSLPGLALPYQPLEERASSGPEVPFSAEQLLRVQTLWPRHRPISGVPLIRSLWTHVVHHEAPNIFSTHAASNSGASERPQPSRRSMDGDCRARLLTFRKKLDDLLTRRDLEDAGLHTSTPQSYPGAVCASSAGEGSDDFPSVEILDLSLEFFFREFHQSLSFIHKATFDARTTPSPLLFAMCLIGLSLLDPQGSQHFLVRHIKKMIQFCRIELASKALGKCQPWHFLMSLASTLLITYLALGYMDYIDECQAHMLCAQMLHIAEKHGVFAAHEGGDFTLELQCRPDEPDGSWTAWARVESIKRMILHLLWLDMAYTRILGTAGVLQTDKVEVYLACEDELFETPSISAFQQAADRGMKTSMPRMHSSSISAVLQLPLNRTSIQTILNVLYLQSAAARHRLLAGNIILSEDYSFTPAEVFITDTRAKDILTSLLALASMHGALLHDKNINTTLSWNGLCIMLTADLNILEIASGREGMDAARAALVATQTWSRTAGARRAIVHAAQAYHILAVSRLSETYIYRPDFLLFSCALVLSLYLYVGSSEQNDSNLPAFELLQPIDWKAIDGEGLLDSTKLPQSETVNNVQQHSNTLSEARTFIRAGGQISFGGEIYTQGGVSARKILLNYASLLDHFEKSNTSKYSRLLRAMSNPIFENCQQSLSI